MADGFQVALPSFEAGSAELRLAAALLSDAAHALSAGLACTGGMAGADHVGQQFCAQYDPAAAALAGLLAHLGPGLGSVADAVEATGANYAAADAAPAMRTAG